MGRKSQFSAGRLLDCSLAVHSVEEAGCVEAEEHRIAEVEDFPWEGQEEGLRQGVAEEEDLLHCIVAHLDSVEDDSEEEGQDCTVVAHMIVVA